MEQFQRGYKPLGITLIGNPGSGKSTILNGIARKSVFRSGISLGSGLTTSLQEHVCDYLPLHLYDTPGLADIEKKKKAGEEIDKVLTKKMSVKIAFVVTLENGRVRPDDAYTLKVVLEAIKSIDVNNMFGVIINKLSPVMMEALKNDKNSELKVQKGITGSFDTSHWIYVGEVSELKDARDGLRMNEDLITFFVGLPKTKPLEAVVEKVDTSDLQEKLDKQRKRIKKIQEASAIEIANMKHQMEHQLDAARKREKIVNDKLKKIEISKKQMQLN